MRLFWIVITQKRQADILPGILIPFSAGVDQKSGIAIGFVVGIGGEGGTKSFDFKEIVGVKQPGNVFLDRNIGKPVDDEKVDAVIISAKDIFGIKIKKMGIVAQFDLHGTDGGFMPVDITFVHGGSFLWWKNDMKNGGISDNILEQKTDGLKIDT